MNTADEARRRHPSSRGVRYCSCGHAEQHHTDDEGCTVGRIGYRCICDGFSPQQHGKTL